MENQRTSRQNRSGHLFFRHVADELNSAGLDMQTVLQKRVGIRWTEVSVKEALFKVLAKAMYNKTSTAQLTKAEFTKVAEMLSDVLARDYGVSVEYPSEESLAQKERIWR